MGCTQSKIENEEAVTRCKQRKRFMKSAVSARSAFASHHSAYAIALKNTGAALSDFGQGEVHDHQPAAPSLPVDSLLPPPPPLPNYPPPLLRAASMPEFVIPKSEATPADPIQEEEDEDGEEQSTSSATTTPGRRGRVVEDVVGVPPPMPPSPPRPPPTNRNPSPPPPPPPEPKESTWDYFFRPDHNLDHDLTPSITPPEEIRRYDTSEADDKRYSDNTHRDRLKRTEKIDLADVASTSTSTSTSTTASKVETRAASEKVIEPTEVLKPVKKAKPPAATQQVQAESKTGASVASHVSLTQILNELDDKFLKAYQSAYEVSKILEANRMHYHSNFADNRGHIDHSAKLMRVITWNRSIKGLQNANDAVDDDYDEHESLASVLDKMLAWEKKLYDEVKVGELMKIEYQRKVAVLNKRQKQGTHSEALEKAKAAVGHLHTRYIVDMQSMDSTVSEIAHLRDDHLYPKLVSLVDGMARMWETMNAQHRAQMKIVEELRSLDITDTPYETTEDHHHRTIQLYGAANDWHQEFSKLMSNQKNYIIALNSWLKLNLIPIESNLKEKVSSPPRAQRPPIQVLLHVWNESLDRLPDELARSAISSFAAIMDNIRMLQEDEGNLKMKCEKTRKDLSRETREFEDWYHKYRERMARNDGMDPDRTEDLNRKDPVGERQLKLELLKERLKDEEETHEKHCKHVREKSLATLKSHLPELFRAMSEFSLAASGMYKKLVPLTQPQKQSESSS